MTTDSDMLQNELVKTNILQATVNYTSRRKSALGTITVTIYMLPVYQNTAVADFQSNFGLFEIVVIFWTNF